MRKRSRSLDILPSLQTIPLEVVYYHILPHLSSIDAAQLRATCQWLKTQVDKVFRFRVHHIRLAHPQQLPVDDALVTEEPGFDEGYEQLCEYGYVGEGRMRFWDSHTHRHVVMNDFYAMGFVHAREHWLAFVEKMKADTEFDFRWRFYEFPTLPGVGRYFVTSDYSVHRGSCILISWKGAKNA